jgi:hypothetical protein
VLGPVGAEEQHAWRALAEGVHALYAAAARANEQQVEDIVAAVRQVPCLFSPLLALVTGQVHFDSLLGLVS